MKTLSLKFILIPFLFVFAISTTTAQTTFLSSGKIEFERKVNLYKQMEGEWMERYKDKMPQFKTTYFNLYFKDNKTLFEKGKDTDEKIPFMGDDKNDEDVIFTNLQQQIFAKKQSVFEETFLLSDTIRKIDWRITNETRNIAGFECNKAVGKILDSVYIIAFYTDQITTSGGPMSFCNLPGMIMGIAIPRINMTIFATKLELIEPKQEKLVIPTGKLKKTNYAMLFQALKKATSDWGNYGRKYIINSML